MTQIIFTDDDDTSIVTTPSSVVDGQWVRPDGRPYVNQPAAADDSYRHAVEATLAWAVANPDSVPAGWVDVETSQVEGRWVHPTGAAAESDNPKLRALYDRVLLTAHRPLTTVEAAGLDEFAAAEQARSDVTGGTTVVV